MISLFKGLWDLAAICTMNEPHLLSFDKGSDLVVLTDSLMMVFLVATANQPCEF